MRGSLCAGRNDDARQQHRQLQIVDAGRLLHQVLARQVVAVNLKYRLRDIQTDCRHRLHDLAPPNRWALTAPTSMALACQWRSRPQHQRRKSVSFPYLVPAARHSQHETPRVFGR